MKKDILKLKVKLNKMEYNILIGDFNGKIYNLF